MTTVNRSGVVAMRKSVAAFFADRKVSANVSLGWRDRTQQGNQGGPDGANRVVFELGEDAGKLAAPHGPGDRYDDDVTPTTSRIALANWEQALTVSVWAQDPSAPEDEEAQLEATENLFEWVIRAVHNFQPVQAVWGSVKRTVAPTERLFGLEIRAQLTLKHPMFDEAESIVYPTPAVARADS